MKGKKNNLVERLAAVRGAERPVRLITGSEDRKDYMSRNPMLRETSGPISRSNIIYPSPFDKTQHH